MSKLTKAIDLLIRSLNAADPTDQEHVINDLKVQAYKIKDMVSKRKGKKKKRVQKPRAKNQFTQQTIFDDIDYYENSNKE